MRSDSTPRGPAAEPATSGLTVAERLIWAGQRLDPESPLYNMALAVELRGPLDVDALRTSFRMLVESDDVLRTRFLAGEQGPRRVVLDRVTCDVELLDLPEAQAPDGEVDRLLGERTARLLPLEGDLFDVCVVRRRPDRFVLYLNQHHIVTDAWSVGVLYRRWGALYAGVLAGDDMPGRSYPRFADHVRREAELGVSPQLGRAVRHWEDTSPGFAAAQPFYGSRTPGSGRTRRVRVPLGEERTNRLRALAADPPFRALTTEQSHYLVFATVLLAWLHRVSGQAAVSIGSPWHNRPSADLRETIGLLIELYPLRVTIEDGETLASLGAKVAAAGMAMLRHVVPGASGTPGARGFAAVLNYITASLGDFAGIPARASWIHSGHGDPQHKFRLQVHDFDAAGEPTLDFDFDEAVFDEASRRWAVAHFLGLLDALAREPDRPLAEIPLVTWEEEAEFAPRGPVRESSDSVLPLLRAQYRERPDEVAVVDGARLVSYRELEALVGAIASGLRERGVRPGDAIGVCLERSTELVAALLGVLEAGAAFVPLDPAYPDGRLRLVAEDAGVAFVLTDAGHEPRVAELGASPLRINDFSASTASTASTADDGEDGEDGGGEPPPTRRPADLAYVLYTSGSTGRPKGVEVTHGALADYAEWACRMYAAEGGRRFPLFTSPAFDLTLTSIFTPLLTGGAIVVYREDSENSALLVRRVLEDDAVDAIKLSPSHLALVRDLDLSRSRVRLLIVGGEDLKTSVARHAHEAFGRRVEIFNEYGPTEATVACMIHRYDPERDRGLSVPIGLPADNARIHILDPRGSPVPRGVKGEICVGGPGLARGYRGRPELTSDAFVEGLGPSGDRLYRTGDVGSWSADGRCEFHGRRDDQVKLRGVRLELGEVEAALARHPAVADAVAHVVEGASAAGEHCTRCGLQGAHPEAQLDGEGVCGVCRRFAEERDRVAAYFGDLAGLTEILRAARESATGPNDTLMLYSGGKDSTYALCRIVELGATPLVFLLDNGFISDQAKENARRVVDQLGLELVIGETPAMPEVFADSLARFSNVCNGCFKVIYTLGMNLAVERGIRAVVTGLSRGQIFETRLADLHRRGVRDPEEVDRTILDARKAYHRMDDAVSRLLDVRVFETDDALDTVRFVDFYRYCDVELDELLDYVERRTPWIRPRDTGRSTNCLINQAGIFVHRTERGFHNYTLPYSWDVRLGHKDRDAALRELDDDLDPAAIRRMLDRVGYRERPAPPPEARLVAYYTADTDVAVPDLRRHLGRYLPADVIPSAFARLERIPLTANGKVDRGALPRPDRERPLLEGAYLAPRTSEEEALVDVWSEVLGLRTIGVEDDFFELGGDSMHCIQIVSAARDRGLVFSPRDLFDHPTVGALARVASPAAEGPEPAAATVSAAELAELQSEFGD